MCSLSLNVFIALSNNTRSFSTQTLEADEEGLEI